MVIRFGVKCHYTLSHFASPQNLPIALGICYMLKSTLVWLETVASSKSICLMEACIALVMELSICIELNGIFR